MYKIAISGKAGSGKDTLSKFLADELSLRGYLYLKNKGLDYSFSFVQETIAFADPIKEMILQMYPQINREHLYGDSKFRSQVIPGSFKDGKPLTIRQLLQDLGEECKKYNPKIWVEAFDYKYQNLSNSTSLVIASDLRFIDEFTYLRDNGFFIIRLLRENLETMNHVSETQQNQIKNEDFDKVIWNTGTLEDLRRQVVEIAKILDA